MKNIIKAQFYQLFHGKLLPVLFVAILFLQLTNISGEMNYGAEVMLTTGDYLVKQGSYAALLATLFGLLFVSQVCGTDFVDKTTNYEVLSGHRRSEVYFGRAVVSLIGGLSGSLCLLAVPMLILSVGVGFGDVILPGPTLVRFALTVFPMFRMLCEIIFISYVVKNSYISMFCSMLLFLFGQNLPMFLTKADSVFLGLTNINGLFNFQYYRTYSAVTLEQFFIYESNLDSAYILSTIASSLIFGVVFLLLGYIFFQKDDLS